jgi:hypothetical protein
MGRSLADGKEFYVLFDFNSSLLTVIHRDQRN